LRYRGGKLASEVGGSQQVAKAGKKNMTEKKIGQERLNLSTKLCPACGPASISSKGICVPEMYSRLRKGKKSLEITLAVNRCLGRKKRIREGEGKGGESV